jgi:hypothetical protein
MARFALSQWTDLHLSPDAAAGSGFAPEAKPKISGLGSGGAAEPIESRWKRPLHSNGTGATHVRTFTGKLNATGLEYMDKFINEWLDNHPNAEVKFATVAVGEFSTSLGKEPSMIVQVWI